MKQRKQIIELSEEELKNVQGGLISRDITSRTPEQSCEPGWHYDNTPGIRDCVKD